MKDGFPFGYSWERALQVHRKMKEYREFSLAGI